MSKLKIRSFDDGYGDVKYMGNGQYDHISSYVTSFKPKPTDEFSLNQIHTQSKYISSEVNGGKYTIGDYAAKLDPNIQWIGGENKHADKRFPILFKTIMGMMNKESYEVVDMLALNLPIKYDTEERRQYLANIVKGSHDMLLSYDGKNYNRKTTHINDVIIKKQPFGSFCYKILNEHGGIKDKELAGSFTVIVDIGARTLNILTVDSMIEQPELTTHTNNGMFEAYFDISNHLKENYNISIPDGKLQQVIQKGEIKNININPLIHIAYQNHANKILSIIEKMFIDSFGFIENIIFTGGGAQQLKSFLEDVFRGRGVKVYFLDRYANAIGLHRYSYRQATKNQNNKTIRINANG